MYCFREAANIAFFGKALKSIRKCICTISAHYKAYIYCTTIGIHSKVLQIVAIKKVDDFMIIAYFFARYLIK